MATIALSLSRLIIDKSRERRNRWPVLWVLSVNHSGMYTWRVVIGGDVCM
ncbi:hypothetical protein Hanom_Chr11g00986861 [Helianthus anomalus]